MGQSTRGQGKCSSSPHQRETPPTSHPPVRLEQELAALNPYSKRGIFLLKLYVRLHRFCLEIHAQMG